MVNEMAFFIVLHRGSPRTLLDHNCVVHGITWVGIDRSIWKLGGQQHQQHPGQMVIIVNIRTSSPDNININIIVIVIIIIIIIKWMCVWAPISRQRKGQTDCQINNHFIYFFNRVHNYLYHKTVSIFFYNR